MKPTPAPVPTPPPIPLANTIAECQQQLLAKLKSGQFALSSSDKEGHRTLCYYRATFLFVSVGEDGTSVLRLPTGEVVLEHLWRQSAYKLVLVEGQYQWNYNLTDAEKLEAWQGILARLSFFTDGNARFVASTLAEFAELAAPQ
ncbi:hypothetical protein J0X19_06705 [Hymenobacter sp. BT186]|uniref:Uncharacterized protein n=1 Tax=Hymenobacter telluris TaxID=2816474 RepID=A0A939ETR1_9BACT|nr:hypothetical protein [Hymenobacter telluris]MBO0357629.1 hypothetical protein [Hymenobacter telluris]MBW3373656.1 hypothetical protein [Hymenobacter norwichensis]